MSQIVVFGAGVTAEVVHHYLTHDSPHEVVAFTVDAEFIGDDRLLGLPVVPFENVEDPYPPDSFGMFVAVGYEDLNQFRAQRYEEAKAKGYELVSYVSSKAGIVGDLQVGDNCFIMENQCLQPHVSIGNNVFIWSGVLVAHHATIGDHCWLASQASIAGSTMIEPYCFIGINATIGHELTIGASSLVGAGSIVTKSAAGKSVFIAKDTELYRLDSRRYLKITKLK